jgi:hypothetical protein
VRVKFPRTDKELSDLTFELIGVDYYICDNKVVEK